MKHDCYWKSFLFIDIGIFCGKLIEPAISNCRVLQNTETIKTALLTSHFCENAEKSHLVFRILKQFLSFQLTCLWAQLDEHAETKTPLNSCWDEIAVKLSYSDKKPLVLDACMVAFMSFMTFLLLALKISNVILK